MQNPKQQKICQPGVVDRIAGDKVFVRMESQAACGSCRAKSYCGMGETTERVVEIVSNRATSYAPGQKVEIMLERSLGYKALFMGYLLPFVLLVASLFIMFFVTGEEGISALVAVALMVPYYGLLYRFRDRLRQTFRFSLRPLSGDQDNV